MELMFEVISRHKFSLGTSSSYVFGNVGGHIGRGQECEWVLPDKSNKVSRKHALISFDGTSFYMQDLSTNGIFTVLGKERLVKGKAYKLEHGLSFLIGDYTVQTRLLHKPDAYISQDLSSSDELIPEEAFLDLDPLAALEQQEEHETKQRLGMYKDLLGTSSAEPIFQSDHSEPRMDAMPLLRGIPEDWEEAAGTVEAEEPMTETDKGTPPPETVSPRKKRQAKPVPAPETQDADARPAESEMENFFRLLGFNGASLSKEERETILQNTAALVIASVDGMIQALQNRAESKNELRLPITTMRLAGNNPLKFSPTAQAALAYLLGAKESGMLPASEAMATAFNDLHSHHMGLLAGARAAVRAALEKISPRQVEARLDINGSVKFSRSLRLWNTFSRMHQEVLGDPDSLSSFFLQDFSRAYDLQIRTLNPLPPGKKGSF